MPAESTVARAARESRRLAILNRVVLAAALAVYVPLVTFTAVNRFPVPTIFATCVMLAELLVFQFVRTQQAHFALRRDQAGGDPAS